MGKKAEFYPRLKDIIERIGEWNINFLQLQREWGIPTSTLYRWRNEIVKEVGLISVENVGREIEQSIIHNLKVCRMLLVQAQGVKEKCEVIKTFNDCQEGYTKFIESYGKKIKIPEQINVDGQVIGAMGFVKLLQEAKNEEIQKINIS